MNNDAMAKIKMLQESTQCLVFGLLGFLPVIGLPFAFAALWIGRRARNREKHYWNAAKPYRIWGVIFALISILSALTVIVINSIAPGIWYSG